ncbi:hypothetical protein FOH10_15900 [Nocardia otitidiscaviarum]|uniref:MFS transporter n=1 Tax=Nocardia otitidiscaviarum TaxID=1823 RepID=A0A516NM45_9NOCA|nr:hypothetical protein [Nocardia otitidiscaviarum]MCP9624891.1 hypothetical protein [Nocardia otitidiscaviarum]QDP79968.1 hypothetical protein FOH10_15900 [Nocardia otitidiscaviarum]
MRSDRLGLAALVLAGAWAGPVAGGQLVLLSKPFGGVVGVPGAAVGYIAITALVTGSVAAAVAVWRRLSPSWAAGVGIVAGLAFIVAGMVTGPVPFVAAMLVASAACGPLIAIGRVVVWRQPRALAGWQVAMTVGVAVAAGTSAIWIETPGTALIVAGIAVGLHSVLALGVTHAAEEPIPISADADAGADAGAGARAGADADADARADADADARADAGADARAGGDGSDAGVGSGAGVGAGAGASVSIRSLLFGYATAGFVLGGTVLPALHLLLFRWEAFGADQVGLLLLAAVPAGVAVALPGPQVGAVPVLLILAAGGPVLVATAPGTAGAAVGIAVTLAAATRAARGLDRTAATVPGHPWLPILTLLAVLAAGVLGLGAVTLLDARFGTGTALTALALPVLIAAALYARSARPRPARTSAAHPVLEGGLS